MLQRIFGSALLLVAAAAAVGLLGATGAVLLLLFFSVLSQEELCRLMGRFSAHPAYRQLLAWTAIIILGSWYLRPQYAGVAIAILALLCVLVDGIARLHPSQLLGHLLPSLFAILYIPFTMQFGAVILRMGSSERVGLCLLGWTVAVSKLNDIGGLLIGGGCGRHTFAAHYSPKKTWEGFFGGMLLATVGGFFLCLLAGIFCQFPLPLWLSLPLSALLAAVGTVADLLESALKRQAQVKDSGRIIPGIGGCLDLCDCLTLTLPTACIAMHLILY